MDHKNLILLTGGTGYVGGRLLQALENSGYLVRCIARRPQALRGRAGVNTEVVFGDCFQPESLNGALAGVHTAYYLVHSMGSAESFETKDRQAANNFAQAAHRAKVQRIIYLGGLGEGALSPHLRSRQEVGKALASTGLEVIEFRASIVIGSGSLSFEIIRALVERLPVMICPAWVSMAAQPIGIEDLVRYLVEALDLPERRSSHHRSRWRGSGFLRRYHARICQAAKSSQVDDFGAGVDAALVESLARSGNPCLRAYRAQISRQHPQSDGGARSDCAHPILGPTARNSRNNRPSDR